LIRPASEKRDAVEAEYTTVNTRVKEADANFFWLAKGEAAAQGAIATGRVVCMTQQPAEYVSVASEVISKAASVQSSPISARYQTVQVERLVSPASERRITIPARTKTVSTQVVTSPAKIEWRQVICQADMTKELVTSLQRALKNKGFDPGPIDGFIGQGTMRAVERYQIDEGIDRGGITFEVLSRLKIQS